MGPDPADQAEILQFIITTHHHYNTFMAEWVCHTEKGWISYLEKDSKKIEAALKSNNTHVDLIFNGSSYRIDFANMKQVNRGTDVSRNIQRISSAVSGATSSQI